LHEPIPHLMNKISPGGVIVGGVVDIVSTGVFALPLTLYIMVKFNLVRVPPDQIQIAMAAAIHTSLVLSILQYMPGIVGSILGGYVAAVIAKHNDLLNGALSAFLCVAFGIYAWVTMKMSVPAYQHVLGFVMSPALGMLGGYLRFAQKNSRVSARESAPGIQ